MKTALICGISGQDGAYLAQSRLARGYRVVGSSRDAQISSFGNLVHHGVREGVEIESVALNDFRSTLQALMKVEPDAFKTWRDKARCACPFTSPWKPWEASAWALTSA